MSLVIIYWTSQYIGLAIRPEWLSSKPAMKLLVVVVVILLVSCSVTLTASAVLSGNRLQHEYQIYSKLFLHIHQEVVEECPNHMKARREVVGHLVISTELEILKLRFEQLRDELVKCRRAKIRAFKTTLVLSTVNPITAESTTAEPTTAVSTTTPPPTVVATTSKPTTVNTTLATILTSTEKPDPCASATVFSESWRLDSNGKDLKPGGPHSRNGYNCDLHTDLDWFRFRREAGILLQPGLMCKCDIKYNPSSELDTDINGFIYVNSSQIQASDSANFNIRMTFMGNKLCIDLEQCHQNVYFNEVIFAKRKQLCFHVNICGYIF